MMAVDRAAEGFCHEDAGHEFAAIVCRGAEGQVFPVALLTIQVIGHGLVRAEKGDGDSEFKVVFFDIVDCEVVAVYYPAGVAKETAGAYCSTGFKIDALEMAINC